MKVRCIKYLTVGPEPKEIEVSPFLTKGKEYIVLFIHSNINCLRYYIQDDGGTAGGYFDAEQFVVTSQYIPDNWIVHTDNDRYLKTFPKKWHEMEGFLEKLHDDDPEAIELFISERDYIYRQEEKFGD